MVKTCQWFVQADRLPEVVRDKNDGIGELRFAIVLHADPEHRAGQRRIVFIQRNQRVESGQHDFSGERRIGELQLSNREFAREFCTAETRHARESLHRNAETVIAGVAVARSAVGSGKHADIFHNAVPDCADHKMRSAVEGVFRRTVQEFPIDKLSRTVDPDASRSDSAERETDFLCIFVLINRHGA